MAAQLQRGQLQPGRPASVGRQRRHRRIREEPMRRCWRSSAASAGVNSQVARAYLGQLAACSQPRQGQRRVAAAGQNHAYPGLRSARNASDSCTCGESITW